VRLGL
jgi:hypothetical protein